MSKVTFPVPAGADSVDIEVSPTFHIPDTPVNQLPTVNCGANQTIKLPTNSVSLSASASDPDGIITGYLWERVSGSGTLSTQNNATTSVSSLIEGTSVFRCTVMDDEGATQFDEVSVIVLPADTPPPPTGYTLVYSNNFSSQADLDPDGHEQYGLGFIDNGQFHSRPDVKSSGVRSEVQLNENRLPTEGAMEWDVTYKYIVQNNCHSFQVHANVSGSSALLALWHMNGNFVVRINNGGSNVSQTQSQQKIQLNTPYHMRVEYKFGTSGYYRWFIGGKLYAEYTGQIKNGNGQYPKLGVNAGFDGNTTEAKKSDCLYDNWSIFKKN